MTAAMAAALEELETMTEMPMRARRQGRGVRRLYSEVAADHGVPVKTVTFLHQALISGWQPAHDHPWRKIAVDLAWHRHRGTIA